MCGGKRLTCNDCSNSGCGGGAAGFIAAHSNLRAHPTELGLIACAEFCSLHVRTAFDDSAYLANGLIADGVGHCLLAGGHHSLAKSRIAPGKILSLRTQQILRSTWVPGPSQDAFNDCIALLH